MEVLPSQIDLFDLFNLRCLSYVTPRHKKVCEVKETDLNNSYLTIIHSYKYLYLHGIDLSISLKIIWRRPFFLPSFSLNTRFVFNMSSVISTTKIRYLLCGKSQLPLISD